MEEENVIKNKKRKKEKKEKRNNKDGKYYICYLFLFYKIKT